MTEARKDRRAPASIKVKYKSANMSEFVELVGGDVSRGGIFVKTKKPLEPGSLLKFEFQLQSGEPMIYGVGRVAWRRTEEGARPTLPAGMGIKFIKLNGLSRSVIDRIEAKHGPGSRFEQTDGAEIASSISSTPPSGSLSPESGSLAPSVPPSATLITPLRPDAMRAAAEADALASPRTGSLASQPTPSGRPTRSSPPLREARATGPKASVLPATFRPPPPAAVGSVPPPHSSSNPPSMTSSSGHTSSSGAFGQSAKPSATSSSNNKTVGQSARASSTSSSGTYGAAAGGSGPAPRGVLGGSAAGRRAVSTRSPARDASEFLASAFSVGGAGREVRSEAHAQAERARHDPRSVDLANELFGDLNAPANKANADATLDADPMLNNLNLPADKATAAGAAATPRPSPGPEASAPASSPEAAESPRLRTPKPTMSRAANDQLSLKLGTGANAKTLPPEAKGGGRVVWISAIALVGLAIGAAAFYVQRGSLMAVPEPKPPIAAAPPPVQPVAPPPAAPAVEAVVTVEVAVSSEPSGAQVSLDGVASGTTPATLKLTQGKTVQLSLSSPGYAKKVESVTVTADVPTRSYTLEPLPYELVVSEPVGATVKVLDKSVEAPAPLNLGALFPPSAPATQEVTVTIEKAGFQRATRKLTRADFSETDSALRADITVPLTPTAPAARATVAKAPVVKAPKGPIVLLKPDPVAPPPEPEATPAAEAPPPPAAQEQPQATAPPPEAAPAPAPEPKAKEAPPPAAPAGESIPDAP